MIALIKEQPPEDERPTLVLMIGTCLNHLGTEFASAAENSIVCDQALIEASVKRQQAELAMLQHALSQCGLIGKSSRSWEA